MCTSKLKYINFIKYNILKIDNIYKVKIILENPVISVISAFLMWVNYVLAPFNYLKFITNVKIYNYFKLRCL